MSTKIECRVFDVEIIVSRMVRVQVPVDLQEIDAVGEEHESIAEEFALGGRESWPEWVIREDEDHDVVSVYEIKEAAA